MSHRPEKIWPEVARAIQRESDRCAIILAEFDAADPEFATTAIINGWTIDQARSEWNKRHD